MAQNAKDLGTIQTTKVCVEGGEVEDGGGEWYQGVCGVFVLVWVLMCVYCLLFECQFIYVDAFVCIGVLCTCIYVCISVSFC